MITIIAGSRAFANIRVLFDECDKYEITEVVSGTARGADKMGEHYAQRRGIPVKRFPANWDLYGRARAGHIRNAAMAEYAERLIAFWDGTSTGTASMINIARSRRLDVHVVRFRPAMVPRPLRRVGTMNVHREYDE